MEAENMTPAATMNPFEPTDLAFLKRVLDDVCVERGVAGGSAAATEMAAEMIQLYQRGVTDEASLHRHFDGNGLLG
jgi:hypothetical protein